MGPLLHYRGGSGRISCGETYRIYRMDLGRVKELIDLFADSGLAELEFREADWQLRLARRARQSDPGITDGCEPAEPEIASSPATADVAPPTAESVDSAVRADAKEVLAPMFGILHLAPAPGAPPFVSHGDAVRSGQTLAVLEAMKMFHDLRSDVDGLVAAILVPSGSEVAAGQPLFRIT